MPQLQFQIDRPSIDADFNINSCDLRKSKEQKISSFQNCAGRVKAESPDKKVWNKNI